MNLNAEQLASLRLLLCGGEALSAHLSREVMALFDGELRNLYGPTEATIDTSSLLIEGQVDTAIAAIGRPISNVRTYVLDANLQVCPVGSAGELYVGGDSLARGYHGRADLTAERFVPDPFTPGARLYRTGDLARYRADGVIDYAELEKQVKKVRPKLIVAGASAYALRIDWERFAKVAKEVGAIFWVDMAHYAGLIADGFYPNPVPHADVVTSTTHKTLRGPRGGLILARKNEELEKKFNSAVFPGGQGGPLEHVIAAKAVCFKEALQPEFKAYQAQVIKNAQTMAQVFIDNGYDVVSGGTENHLFLLSLIKQDITGKDADAALGRAFITVNKNSVPNDPRSPFVTSGLRIGTPAVTTRGFKEDECRQLAGWICDVLANIGNDEVEGRVREQVKALCAKFPVYGN